jgi:hypothetical protein
MLAGAIRRITLLYVFCTYNPHEAHYIELKGDLRATSTSTTTIGVSLSGGMLLIILSPFLPVGGPARKARTERLTHVHLEREQANRGSASFRRGQFNQQHISPYESASRYMHSVDAPLF